MSFLAVDNIMVLIHVTEIGHCYNVELIFQSLFLYQRKCVRNH